MKVVGVFCISILLSGVVGVNVEALTSLKIKDSITWIKYREARGEHDCMIDENKNWLGI